MREASAHYARRENIEMKRNKASKKPHDLCCQSRRKMPSKSTQDDESKKQVKKNQY